MSLRLVRVSGQQCVPRCGEIRSAARNRPHTVGNDPVPLLHILKETARSLRVDPRRSTILQATPYLLVEAGGRRFKSCPKSGRCGAPDRAASWDPRAYGPRAQDPTGLSGPCTSVE